MSVRRLSKTFISGAGAAAEKSSSFLANYSPAIDEMDLIERVVVGSGGTSSITFSNIPQTYQHLQIRTIARHTSSTTGNDSINIRLNSDSGSNYAIHRIYGNGTAAVADAYTSQTAAWTLIAAHGGNAANIFAVGILDILDYSSSTKNSTLRALVSGDYNGSGSVNMNSSLWISTAAISSISLTPGGAYNFAQYTTASLYGVKA